MARKEKQKTNSEFINNFIDYGSPMRQVWLIDCLHKMADYLIENEEEFLCENKNSFFHPGAWLQCAKDWKKEFAEYFKDEQPVTYP